MQKFIPFLLLISLVMLLFQLPFLHTWMTWKHDAIQTGEVWRILTGNFTHTNGYHLSMNLIGLWFIGYIFRADIQPNTLLIVTLFLSSLVGLLLFFTSITEYMGLSGTLHGLFGYYAMIEFKRGERISFWLIVGLLAKIAWESYFGSSIGTEILINANIATEAHAFGALTGLILPWLPWPKSRTYTREK